MPNPSFEDYSLCPGLNGGNANTLNYWDIDINTVDNFNSCDTIYPFNAGVPYNAFGNQCASTGNGYAGLYFYGSNGFEDAREMFGGSLISPLVVGQKYYISFKVSSAESSYSVNNNLGMRFTNRNLINSANAQIILPPPFIDNAAHIFSNTIVVDTLGWTQIKGSFVADSAYNNFLFGCFYDYNHIDTILKPGFNFCKSYYYLDDVCLSTDSLLCNDIKPQLLTVLVDSTNIDINECVNFSLQTGITYNSTEWFFEGGFPSSSSAINPSNICYLNVGSFDITFIGYKYGGCADTIKLNNFIHVDDLTNVHNLPLKLNELHFDFSDNKVIVTNMYSNYNYNIYNIIGKEIKKGQLLTSNNQINCSDLNAGIYILSITNSTIKPIKFIINPK